MFKNRHALQVSLAEPQGQTISLENNKFNLSNRKLKSALSKLLLAVSLTCTVPYNSATLIQLALA